METKFCLTDDVIDVRNLIERYEELETDLLACFNEQQTIEGDDTETDNPEDSAFQEWLKVTLHEDYAEFIDLLCVLKELQGGGGDEQWRGDWYPNLLVRDSHFEQYARDLAEDTGAIDKNNRWPNCCIDWEYAAKELKYDYSSTDINGTTYWFR